MSRLLHKRLWLAQQKPQLPQQAAVANNKHNLLRNKVAAVASKAVANNSAVMVEIIKAEAKTEVAAIKVAAAKTVAVAVITKAVVVRTVVVETKVVADKVAKIEAGAEIKAVAGKGSNVVCQTVLPHFPKPNAL